MESVIVSEENNVINLSRNGGKPPLKVLWFTTSPSLSRPKLDGSYNVGTSWIEAMEALVLEHTNIELAIAFIWKTEKMESFGIDQTRTRYYAMPRRPINKYHNLFRQSLCLAEPESIADDCMEVVNDFQPDIVNFFGTETPFPLIIPRLSIPHIIWFQGNLTVYHEKWNSGISWWQSLRSERLKDILRARTDLHSYIQNRIFVQREKRIFNTAQNFIGRTDWDKRLVSTMAPQANYFHGDEIMRPAFYDKKWKAHNRDKYVLVSTFRDNLYKGLECAMRAFQILEPLLDKPLEWQIIGVPQGSHYERVCRRITKLSKERNLKIMGLMSADEMIIHLLDADIFVHPSHIDNSPNSLCEAMLLGLPIVTTNVGGIPSILKENEEGLMVQNGDEYAMAGAILNLLKDPSLAASFGKNARARAEVRNDGELIIKEITSIYHDLYLKVNSKTN